MHVIRWPAGRAVAGAPRGLRGDGRHRRRRTGVALSEDGAGCRLPEGAFAWIDTGDPMPPGTDTVVERERVRPRPDGGVAIDPGPRCRAGATSARRARTSPLARSWCRRAAGYVPLTWRQRRREDTRHWR